MVFGLLTVEGDPVLDEIGEIDGREGGWLERDTNSVIAKLSKDSRPSVTNGSDDVGPWVPDMSVAYIGERKAGEPTEADTSRL